jgi:hypothetical protein
MPWATAQTHMFLHKCFVEECKCNRWKLEDVAVPAVHRMFFCKMDAAPDFQIDVCCLEAHMGNNSSIRLMHTNSTSYILEYTCGNSSIRWTIGYLCRNLCLYSLHPFLWYIASINHAYQHVRLASACVLLKYSFFNASSLLPLLFLFLSWWWNQMDKWRGKSNHMEFSMAWHRK